MRPLDAFDVLMLWEQAGPRHAIDRSALFCARARPELPADQVADLPLGIVTASLLGLREVSFGARIDGYVDCLHCGTRLALELMSSDLVQPVASGPPGGAQDWRLRAPCLRDLAAVANEPDSDRAARLLLARCTLEGPDDAMAAADDALRRAEAVLEALDPNAQPSLSVHCEECGGRSTVQVDVGQLLWDDIDGRARALLHEVHALAHAYGWCEGEILALSPARRATYLAMVTG
jgi:hypothetical protein